MKLYYSPAACSLSPHIVAREAGIPVELVKVDLKTHTLGDGTDYTTINPKGSVPLLELDDGDRLSEGPAIVQYLADRNPASGLAPAAGTMPRYHLQEWLNFVTSELHKQYSPLFDASVPAEYKEAVKTRLAKRLDWLSTKLAGQDYLTGAQFTRGRRVPLHGVELEQVGGHRYGQVAGARRLPGAGRRAAEGAGSDEGRRPAQVGRESEPRDEAPAHAVPVPRIADDRGRARRRGTGVGGARARRCPFPAPC